MTAGRRVALAGALVALLVAALLDADPVAARSGVGATARLAGAAREPEADRVNIIVGFHGWVCESERRDIHHRAEDRGGMGVDILSAISPTSVLVAVTGAPSAEAAVAAYSADPRVAFAEPDAVLAVAEGERLR
jgi:hypothetical protein